jgi:uncharacterized membrane protein YheB (UPF0754 family)
MAPPKVGKTQFNVRLKVSTIEAYKEIAASTGHPTHAMLCAEILEGCLEYLLDSDRSRMPDILLNLKQKLPTHQLEEVSNRIKESPAEHDRLEKLIESIVDQKLKALKKTSSRATLKSI